MPTDSPAAVVKLRVKLGTHEFEAEGPHEIVHAHFRTWQQLVAADPSSGRPPAPIGAAATPEDTTAAALDLFAVDPQCQLVTLRQSPLGAAPPADAALLLLYGFQQSLGTAGRTVLVTRLKAALAASGYPEARVDRTLARHVGARFISKRGRRIGSTYQLTSSGVQHADALAHTLSQGRRPPA